MLGTGLMGMFYTMTLHGQRGRDRVEVVYSRDPERARRFGDDWAIPHRVTRMKEAVGHTATDRGCERNRAEPRSGGQRIAPGERSEPGVPGNETTPAPAGETETIAMKGLLSPFQGCILSMPANRGFRFAPPPAIL